MNNIYFLILALCILTISCKERKTMKNLQTANPTETISIKIPDTTVDKSELFYNKKSSVWTLNGKLYSGSAVSFYPDGSLQEKINILNGKKESQAIQWYPNGDFKQIAHYHKGKLHGVKKVWLSNIKHILTAQLIYQNGKPHGEQRTWYPSGELHKILNLNMGREEGIQQAYRKNGFLYANYEAKEGRIFGLKKAALCYGLEEEYIINEN